MSAEDELAKELEGIDIWHYPAQEPPLGVEPNFVNPPTLAPTVITMEVVFVFLMLCAVAVRVYTRTRIQKSWGWDDLMCMLAVIGSLASMGIILRWIDALYWGRHMWDIPVAIWLDESNVRLLSVATTYPWTACFAKLSLLLLYRRLFPYSRLRFFIWGGIIVVGALYGMFIIMSFVSPAVCVSFHAGVTPFCSFVHTVVNLWQSSVNVVTDFYLVILPIPRVLRLQVSTRRKVGLVITFASGLGASVASLARLIRIVQLYHAGDSSWTSASVSLYGIVELNVGIIVACVSTFPHFFNKVRGSKFGSIISRSIRSVLKSQSSRSSNSSVLPLSEAKQEPDVVRAVGPGPGIASTGKFKPHETVSDIMGEVENMSNSGSGRSGRSGRFDERRRDME